MKHILCFWSIVVFVFTSSFAQNKFDTPLEKSAFKKLSSNSDIISYLTYISANKPFIKIDTIYKTIQNRIMPLVIINDENIEISKKLKILIIGQQHGNEPSGKEGLLLLIKEIAIGKYDKILKKVQLFIIPQANPDGGDANTRRNANKIDLNRDHLLLNAEENIAIHKVFDKYLPDVTIDIHEYYPFLKEYEEFGYRKNFDVQIGCLTNLNIDSEIMKTSKYQILPFIFANIQKNNFTSGEYIVGDLPRGERLRHSTVDINDGRQSFGIENTYSFIIEGINGKDSLSNIEHRYRGQYIAISSFLEYFTNHTEFIKESVKKARQKLIKASDEDSIILRMDHFKSLNHLNYRLLSITTNRDTVINVENYYSEVTPLLSVHKPLGYLVPKSDSLLISFMKKNNFKYFTFKNNKKYLINQFYVCDIQTDTIEEQAVNTPSLKTVKSNLLIIESDYYFIPINQIKSSKISLAFEPLSMHGLINHQKFKYLLSRNNNYPILRVENTKQ